MQDSLQTPPPVPTDVDERRRVRDLVDGIISAEMRILRIWQQQLDRLESQRTDGIPQDNPLDEYSGFEEYESSFTRWDVVDSLLTESERSAVEAVTRAWLSEIERFNSVESNIKRVISGTFGEIGRTMAEVLDELDIPVTNRERLHSKIAHESSLMLTPMISVAKRRSECILAALKQLEQRMLHAISTQSKLRTILDDGVGSYASAQDLAKKHGVDAEALRKRLERWRKDHDTGYMETDASSRKSRDPSFLYREQAVMDVIQNLKEQHSKNR